MANGGDVDNEKIAIFKTVLVIWTKFCTLVHTGPAAFSSCSEIQI